MSECSIENIESRLELHPGAQHGGRGGTRNISLLYGVVLAPTQAFSTSTQFSL